MKYKMKKISMDEGKSSEIVIGSEVTGYFFIGIEQDSGEFDIKEVESDLEIAEIGNTIMVHTRGWDYIKCSPILEILEQSKNKLVIKTTTSTYEIIKEIKA